METHDEDDSYEGFGPLFAAEANRIGNRLDLDGVVERNRTGQPEQQLCKFWPHNVRLIKDPLYYGDDVFESLLDLAAGRHGRRSRHTPPPSLGLLELLLSRVNIFDEKRAVERTRELLVRHIDRLQRQRERAAKPKRAVEAGIMDVDGSPLPEVTMKAEWLLVNNGIARKVAEAIYERREFSELPILADALEDAGCGGTDAENAILRHLRANIEHTCNCWVLRKIREVGNGA